MSIIDSFDTSEEVLNPSYIYKKETNFPKYVVSVFTEDAKTAFLKLFQTEIIGYLFAGVKIPIYRIGQEGHEFALYQSPIGSATTAGLMEEIIAKGGETFLYFGSCGTLDKEIAAGHFIIPTSAYRDEGVSYHYLHPADYIDIDSAPHLTKLFSSLNLPFITGKTWTTDAFYRETKANMMKRKAEGCIAVEMECAAIMSVAKFRKISAYQYLYAEDTLDGVTWDARTMGNVSNNVYERYAMIAAQIITALQIENKEEI